MQNLGQFYMQFNSLPFIIPAPTTRRVSDWYASALRRGAHRPATAANTARSGCLLVRLPALLSRQIDPRNREARFELCSRYRQEAPRSFQSTVFR